MHPTTNGIYWDKITKIEYISESSYKYDYVYDFSVCDTETFTIGNGIIVHNTLNTFHSCGISSKSQVNQGVPRIRELISVSKKIKTPSMKIYLTDEYKNNELLTKKLLHEIKYINFDFFIDNTSIWYDSHWQTKSCIKNDELFVKQVYNNNLFNDENLHKYLSPWVLRIELYPVHLINKNVSMFDIYYFLLIKFGKRIDKLFIVFSDENAEHNIFHIRFLHKDINIHSNNIPCTNIDFKRLLEIEQELSSNCLFKGIREITKANICEITDYTQESINKENIIITSGTNLQKILQYENVVNICKTISNDIHEVYANFGIEAARRVLELEIYDVLNQSGVDVNCAHVELLIDAMTLNGGLISMNRYGISKTDNGIFAMASFEEPDEHFVNAATHNISDYMNSTASNIAMGQICEFGTGLVELIFDLNTL